MSNRVKDGDKCSRKKKLGKFKFVEENVTLFSNHLNNCLSYYFKYFSTSVS